MAEPASPPLVLVIDDAADARNGLAEFLESRGFQAATARDAYEGLARATDLKPDIILMDLAMPGLDGIEAARLLKRETATSGIPIVAFTGQIIVTDLERIRAWGFAELISKPCDLSKLAETLRRILSRQ